MKHRSKPNNFRDVVMDDDARVGTLLESLTNGTLSRRIQDAAHLAMAKHLLLTAQNMQSAVEAENSTK